jgi:hypothetical protein
MADGIPVPSTDGNEDNSKLAMLDSGGMMIISDDAQQTVFNALNKNNHLLDPTHCANISHG